MDKYIVAYTSTGILLIKRMIPHIWNPRKMDSTYDSMYDSCMIPHIWNPRKSKMKSLVTKVRAGGGGTDSERHKTTFGGSPLASEYIPSCDNKTVTSALSSN